MEKVPPRMAGWLAIPIVVAAIAAFAPIASNGFINIDDDAGFLNNTHLTGLTLANIRWACTSTQIDAYQPLPRLLYLVESAAWGVDPRGYHVVSLLLHASVGVALYFLILGLIRRARPEPAPENPWRLPIAAAIAATAFVVNPLRTEVVAWAICQAYLPCALFAILSISAYLRSADGGPMRRAWLIGSVLLYAGSLACYQNPIGLPLVLIVLDGYPLRRIASRGEFGRRVVEKIPFFAISLVFAAVAVSARRHDLGISALVEGGLGSRILQASYAACFYVIKTFLPTGLCHAYPLRGQVELSRPAFFLGLLGVVGVTGAAFALRKRKPAIAAAWAGYLLILAPNSGLVKSISVVAADRYSYLATAALAPLLAVGLDWGLGKGRKRVLAVAAASVLIWVGMTRAQCLHWRDSVELWSHAMSLQQEPDAFFEVGLGRALGDAGRWAEARPHLAEAVQLSPGYGYARSKYGQALLSEGEFAEAQAELAEAVRMDPGDYEARTNLGFALSNCRRLPEAEEQFAEVVRILPGLVGARTNLGAVLIEQGKAAEAEPHFAEAVRLDPERVGGHMDLGFALAQQNKFAEAAQAFGNAVKLRPDDPDARHNLGFVLSRQGRLAEAFAQYNEAIKLKPDHQAALQGRDELLKVQARLTGQRAN